MLVSVTVPINAANATNVTVSGTGDVGATITLVATDDGDNSTIEYTTVVGEDGTWTIAGIDVSALAEGTLTFTATAADAAGNTAQSSSTAIKDTIAPAIAVTNVNAPVSIASQHSTAASGTGEVGATITLVASNGENSTIEYTTVVGEDGAWSITGIDVSALADGTITYAATAADAAGNTAQDSLATTKTTIAITPVSEPINAETASSVTVSGTGEAGATVSVYAGDDMGTTSTYTTVISEDGTWSIGGIDVSELADGTIVFSATAEDSLGNVATDTRVAMKDTVAPEVAIATVTVPINSENAADVTASGTGEVGVTISLAVTDDGDNSTNEYTTVVGEDGTWSIAGIDISGLADGTVAFTATASDNEGNTAQASLTATKDTVVMETEITSVTDPIDSENATNVAVGGTGEVGATIARGSHRRRGQLHDRVHGGRRRGRHLEHCRHRRQRPGRWHHHLHGHRHRRGRQFGRSHDHGRQGYKHGGGVADARR